MLIRGLDGVVDQGFARWVVDYAVGRELVDYVGGFEGVGHFVCCFLYLLELLGLGEGLGRKRGDISPALEKEIVVDRLGISPRRRYYKFSANIFANLGSRPTVFT